MIRCPWILVLAVWAPAAHSQPQLTHVDVFRAGQAGYASYRIPAIVTAADGSLIAFAEARRDNRGDPGAGDIEVVMSRSTNNGDSWSAMQVVDDPGVKWAASNPTPLLDRSNGRLWLFFNRWEPGFGTIRSMPGTANNQIWARWSDDHGRTWSPPRDLTRAARDYDHWGAMFLGPGGAIQTKSGRLLIPAAMKPDAYSVLGSAGGFTGPVQLMRAYTLISDDHGQTWRRGALVGALTNENQLVELADGAILMDARQNAGDHRWNMTSQDGGETWSQPRPGQSLSPVATGIERYTLQTAGADRDRLLWTGPSMPGRRHLVVRVSYDEGQTWLNERVLYGGFAAYSDLTLLPDGTPCVLWERGLSEATQYITFTRFNREFLEPPGSVIPRLK
ncbi:MAG: sialidase family protein [Bryobacteraceae bacterium]|nr:sialidase family protein [Bryobacteraceae bacterium]